MVASERPARPVLAIVGPTAVGKTALSLAVAQQCDGEVISADSRLFYRGLDIGSAKPTPAERALVPHHLIDLCEPDETVTLGAYQEAAVSCIAAVQARGRLPILVGGAGQYVWSVLEGWGIPRVPPQPALRAALEEREAADLYADLQGRDPVAAAAIHPHNKRRLIRALEVCLTAGRPISELQARRPPAWDVRIVGLTCARPALYERIDRRVDAMLEAGLLEEVAALHACGYDPRLPALSGLGYRQLWPYLDGARPLDEAVALIKRETRRFVRQQYNWFALHDPRIAWVDVLAADYPAALLREPAAWLGRAPHLPEP